MNCQPIHFACRRAIWLLPFLLLGIAAAAAQPNFIIIMADDLGYGELSCYGNQRYQTPHLDALAKEGLKFTDFHSNGAVCSPTRAALLTGRYQQRTGITDVVFADPARGKRADHGLQQTEITFSKLLRQAGYRTALMGKWHLGYAPKFNPMHHGFDVFRGFVSGNVDFHSHYDQADFFDWWQDLELKDEPGYTTHLITRHAVRFIEENQDRPFCLYVPHEAPHAPFQGPNDPPVRGPNKQPPLTGDEISRAYREMVQELDKGIGEIIATLRRLGLDKNTFVFFTSDNGASREGTNAPLKGSKGSLWEGGHRVPAIAWWPGRIKPNIVTSQTGLIMDLLPTMLELAGAKAPANHPFDGVSLAPVLRGEPLKERLLFWEYNGRMAIRQGDWKLLVGEAADRRARKSDTVALFNLAADLAEANDLAAQHPERVSSLRAALEAWRSEVQPKTQ